MVEELLHWFVRNYKEFLQNSCTPTFQLSFLQPKPGGYIRVESEKTIAGLNLWETGECEVEIVDVETEKRIFWDYQILHSSEEVREYLNVFFRKVIVNKTE